MRSNYLRFVTSALGSALTAVVLTAAIGIAIALFATEVLETYGLGLFVATPAALGFFAAVVRGLGGARSAGEGVEAGALAVLLANLALVGFAYEGLICIVMALPLTVALGAIGALVGHAVYAAVGLRAGAHAVCLVALLPVVIGIEARVDAAPPLRSVTTQVVVHAPPTEVWRHVVSVEPLPPPTELIFRAGIAYPTRATISGSGVGAVRRCTFSTGDFVEPITVWEPGRRLEFRVASQPAPMTELSPWRDVDPPHLDGFLHSERGRFELIALPGGRTLLRGTSWYRNRMWPQPYWGFLADQLMRRIHLRVLRHVERLAEQENSERGRSRGDVRAERPRS